MQKLRVELARVKRKADLGSLQVSSHNILLHSLLRGHFLIPFRSTLIMHIEKFFVRIVWSSWAVDVVEKSLFLLHWPKCASRICSFSFGFCWLCMKGLWSLCCKCQCEGSRFCVFLRGPRVWEVPDVCRRIPWVTHSQVTGWDQVEGLTKSSCGIKTW
jgi:hypothetical protein